MARLLIQAGDEGFERVRWAIIDEEQAMADVPWQDATADELSSLAAQNPHPVVMVIPQQCVYLTQVEIPEKASRQVLTAIEFQIEDQLAQDIDSQHFAIADAGENPVSVAVIEKSIMKRCMDLVRSSNLRLAQIVPEVFLCPWPGDGVNLITGDNGVLVRYGEYRGMKCQKTALPAMLEMISREVESDRIRYFASAGDTTLELENIEFEVYAADSARLGLVEAPLIDLQQREFKASSVWREIAGQWRWVAIFLAALLLVGGYNRLVTLQQLEDEIAAVRSEQFETVKRYLPAGTSADDNLKNLLLDRVRLVQGGQGGKGFMQLLVEFSKARTRFTAVNIDRIGYQNNELNIDINSTKLKDIEDLHAAVQKQGIEAKLENLNIKPELISGRLVLNGGGNV